MLSVQAVTEDWGKFKNRRIF